MSSNVYSLGDKVYKRSNKQGRKSSGLSSPKLFRLFQSDVELLERIKEKQGIYYNENELVRFAVHTYLESVYTELLKQ